MHVHATLLFGLTIAMFNVLTYLLIVDCFSRTAQHFYVASPSERERERERETGVAALDEKRGSDVVDNVR